MFVEKLASSVQTTGNSGNLSITKAIARFSGQRRAFCGHFHSSNSPTLFDSGEHGCIQIKGLIWASPASNPKSRKVEITVFTTLLIFGIRDWNLKLTIFFSYYFKSYQAATCFLLSGFTNFILIYLHKLGLLLYIILNSIPLPRKIINAIFNTKNNKKIKWIIFLNKY